MAKVLVVGGGSREHALGFGLRAHTLLFAPGNAGTATLGTNVEVAATDIEGLVALAKKERVDLVVVGPEAPLTLGLVDALEAAGVRAFGPSKAAAQLEGSKAFMKRLLADKAIPTAAFAIFEDAAAAKAHVTKLGRPLVVKADGLAAGKGVFVPSTVDETLAAIDTLMVARELGDAGATVVLEELLPGEEASFHVVCDGTRALPLVAAQDHKRALDGDRGPNTGGMGAYAPAPIVTAAMADMIMTRVVTPTLEGMRERGAPFRGVLFVGLMIDRDVVNVLEFNVRFGDPETTVLVPMFDGDWFALLDGAARGDLSGVKAGVREGAALAVVMAAEHYPRTPTKGDVIRGLDAVTGAHVFHAGTRREENDVVTAGGRVLTVCATAPSLARAHAAAYEAVDKIGWRGEHHRRDIGQRALG